MTEGMTDLPPPEFEHLAAFEVLGVPAPQGSKSRMPNGMVIEGSSKTGRAKHKAWRAAVADVARDVAEERPHDGPLAVDITFRMPMPASRPKRMRTAGRWPCTVKPDIDKVVRTTLDALADGGLIAGDSRVWKLDVEQVEVTSWTGAEILLRRWTGGDR